jgi:cytochrome c oxidase subunit 3
LSDIAIPAGGGHTAHTGHISQPAHGSHVAHGAHHGHPALQHQFQTMQQQKEAAVLGMWAFLLTEILFFGGLFMAYLLYRTWYHDAFVAASTSITLSWGLINTVVLIGSSLTMALAVRAAQLSHRKATVNWLLLTMVLGAAFLGIKVIEYADKFEHHHVPGPNYIWEADHAGAAAGEAAAADASHGDDAVEPDSAHPGRGSDAANYQLHTQIFFSLYFTMTGLHALHMIIGLGLLGTIAWMAHRGRFSSEYYTPVEMSGLYWHFVDIVWIFLFPLLYLIDRS